MFSVKSRLIKVLAQAQALQSTSYFSVKTSCLNESLQNLVRGELQNPVKSGPFVLLLDCSLVTSPLDIFMQNKSKWTIYSDTPQESVLFLKIKKKSTFESLQKTT